MSENLDIKSAEKQTKDAVRSATDSVIKSLCQRSENQETLQTYLYVLGKVLLAEESDKGRQTFGRLCKSLPYAHF